MLSDLEEQLTIVNSSLVFCVQSFGRENLLHKTRSLLFNERHLSEILYKINIVEDVLQTLDIWSTLHQGF